MFKRAMLIVVLMMSTYNIGDAHKEWVHQYMVKEAYKLLELQVGVIPELRNHMGMDFWGSGDDANPWATGFVSVAAWREDMEDVIWGKGTAFSEWTPSATHFWNADLGDGHKTPIPASPDAFNAYHKARVFLFGGHRIFFAKTAFAADVGQVILGRFYSYNSLVEFIKTGRAYYEGYIDLARYVHLQTPREVFLPTVTARTWGYQILGRVAHLLGDMSVPAHVKDDLHPCEFGDPDSYELDMGSASYGLLTCNDPRTVFYAQNFTASNALLAGGMVIPPANVDAIRYLFYTSTQVADHFPSTDITPGNNNLPNGSFTFLENLYVQLGPPPSIVNHTEIAPVAFVYAIRATAGLFRWFAKELGHLPDIVVPNQYSTIEAGLAAALNGQKVAVLSGTYYVGTNITINQGITLDLQPGVRLSIATGSKITANGRLTANGTSNNQIYMYSTQFPNQTWQGIEFSGSGANNSSLQYCNINFAASPIVATNTSNLTISNVIIGNSNFQNYPHDAAMAFYNSSPTISSVIINGQSNSWNGVRFAQGSTGSIQYSTIQNCGDGMAKNPAVTATWTAIGAGYAQMTGHEN